MPERKKIMVIFGTRPEATKLGPVVQELKNYPDWFETKVVVTGPLPTLPPLLSRGWMR